MRALIRGKEVCPENAWTKWQRMNMLFLTGKEKDADGNPLPGDGWTLVKDYVREDHDDFDPTPACCKAKDAVQAPPAQAPASAPAQDTAADIIVIDGVKYTRSP